jgi:hypothetical protein
LKKRRLGQSRAKTMVYVHSNLRLIYRIRDHWLKGKTKVWDVFPDDMGLNNNIELALANFDLNELELVTFNDGDPLKGSWVILTFNDGDPLEGSWVILNTNRCRSWIG